MPLSQSTPRVRNRSSSLTESQGLTSVTVAAEEVDDLLLSQMVSRYAAPNASASTRLVYHNY
eukprot:765703-Hanusia_phi.AAC.5